MPLSRAPLPERRSAQVIYPAAFHPGRVETPQQWADEALRLHLEGRANAFAKRWASEGTATPQAQLEFRQAADGQLVDIDFPIIVAPLPQPPCGWLARLLRGAL
jgi:hypothetical protein